MELRRKYRVPVFALTSNHNDEGRIQGKQLAALRPKGGRILHVVGPNTDFVSQQRLIGMTESKPGNIQLSMIRGGWTMESGCKAVSSWWNLPTSRQQPIVAVVAHNDAMALGAQKALEELSDDRVSNIPVIGCDGLPESGQAWVQRGLLKATVVVPVLAGLGIELLLRAIIGKESVPEHTVIAPKSYPSLKELDSTLA
jgi:ribose transport system substrate-binding protein